MSKENNLTDFLTDVADAIREKKGLTNLINPQDFHDEILSIKSGGGPVIEGEGAYKVTFIDYDGTILKVQYLNEGESATPPDVPEHEHLTFNEWVGAYTNVTSDRAVCAYYISSDGNTWLYTEEDNVIIDPQCKKGTLTIEFGDGATYTGRGTYLKHHYTDGQKEHWISISANRTDAGLYFYGYQTPGLYGISTIICGDIYKKTMAYDFKDCYGLKYIVLPQGLTQLGARTFYDCFSLKHVTIPSSVTSISSECFYKCYSLVYLVIPNGITGLTETWTIADCHSLNQVTFPDTLKTLGNYSIYNCYALSRINLEMISSIGNATIYGNYSLFGSVSLKSIVTIGNNAFSYCKSLVSIRLPSTVTSIGNYFCDECDNLKYVVIEATTPPDLGSGAFGSYMIDTYIFVPDESINAYKEATNWSSFADLIFGISEINNILS